ncbi:MAG: hypothetical protein ACREMB_22480 [Candidatus Rokuibacteriota bacterium]
MYLRRWALARPLQLDELDAERRDRCLDRLQLGQDGGGLAVWPSAPRRLDPPHVSTGGGLDVGCDGPRQVDPAVVRVDRWRDGACVPARGRLHGGRRSETRAVLVERR